MSGPRQLCTFRVADAFLAVPVEDVQEIGRHQQATPIPLAPRPIRGLINLRGQIVPAIDSRRCLGLADRPEGAEAENVIVRADDGLVSLLVDEIGDVLHVDTRSLEAPPVHLRPEMRRLITGVCQLPDMLVSVLDVRAVIAATTEGMVGRLEGALGAAASEAMKDPHGGATTHADNGGEHDGGSQLD